MISWIQNIMQRHHKWLFGALLIVIIVAFVFTIGNTGGVGSGNPQDVRLEFFGVNLNSPREIQSFSTDARLSAQLNQQRFRSENDLQAATLQRITTLYMANKLGLPGPNEEQLGAYIREIPAFRDPQTGRFSPDSYTALLDQAKNNPNFGEDGFIRVLADDYRIDQVVDALGGPGYVMPYIAKRQLEVMDTKWTVDVATFGESGFKPEVTPTAEELETYFQENSMRYASGTQVVVDYISFPVDDYYAEVTDPSNAQLLNYYREERNNFAKGEDGNPLPLSENRDAVIKAWKEDAARDKAIAAANALAYKAYEASYAETLKADKASIEAFAQSNGHSLKSLPAFSRDNPPAALDGVPRASLNQIAQLNDKRIYSDGLSIDGGAAVFFLVEELPSTTPPMAEVEDEVKVDYIADKTKQLYNLRALELKKQLQDDVDAGDDFVEKAKALGLTVQSYADFSLSSPPQGLDYFVRATLESMKTGQVSDLQEFGNLGTLVYVREKSLPSISIDSEEVKNNIKQMASFSSRATSQGIINEMMLAEEERVKPEEF